MTSPCDVVNEALDQIGARATVSSFSDPSPAAQAASRVYTPKVQMILRAANWNCARKQVFLTELKSLYINGALSVNPPPQPFLFEYLYPSDCLKVRFVPQVLGNQATGTSPPLTTGGGQYPVAPRFARFVPFVVGLDTDASNNPLKVILTNQCKAQAIYTADISQTPDLWDSQLHAAVVSTIASFLVNPLARNAALMSECVGAATSLLSAARATDGNEALPSQDHMPDWLRIRASGSGFAGGYGGLGVENCAGWDAATFGNGLSF